MDAATWDRMTDAQRDAVRVLDSLSPQLVGLEGWRVEVETEYGEVRRFIVGRSTGWVPIHLEISRRTAMSGGAAERQYKTVRPLYKARV